MSSKFLELTKHELPSKFYYFHRTCFFNFSNDCLRWLFFVWLDPDGFLDKLNTLSELIYRFGAQPVYNVNSDALWRDVEIVAAELLPSCIFWAEARNFEYRSRVKLSFQPSD